MNRINNVLSLIGRGKPLFLNDIHQFSKNLEGVVLKSTFLILGGAGSIGQAVVKEIFKRGPKKIHVVDINENNLTELVRDIRSSFGYIEGDFKVFLEYCDISEEYFNEIIDSCRSPHLWEKIGDDWTLKAPIWK